MASLHKLGIVILICAGVHFEGTACSCMPSTIEESFENSAAIFSGYPLKVTVESYTTTAIFVVERLWKGDLADTIELSLGGLNSASCLFEVEKSKKYIIHAHEAGETKASTNLCTQSSIFDEQHALKLDNLSGSQSPETEKPENSHDGSENDRRVLDVPTDSRDSEVYPNPSEGKLLFRNASNIDQVQVYNTLGSLIAFQINEILPMDVSSWKRGLYIYRIQTKSGQTRYGKLLVR